MNSGVTGRRQSHIAVCRLIRATQSQGSGAGIGVTIILRNRSALSRGTERTARRQAALDEVSPW
jgi:hypothetical protein